MNILTAAPEMGLVDFSIIAVLGYAVVFLGLILLMIVVTIVGKAFAAADTKKAAAAEKEVLETPVEKEQPVAPGTAGEVKLYNVEPKIAAMLMAIVADKLQKPINELRFISIKEVE